MYKLKQEYIIIIFFHTLQSSFALVELDSLIWWEDITTKVDIDNWIA
jgi:hypothetical protein